LDFNLKQKYTSALKIYQSVGENTLSFFFSVGSVGWKKMKVCFVRWQKIELKNLCVDKKKLKTKRWLSV